MKKKFQNIVGALIISTMLFTSLGTGVFANVNDGVENDAQDPAVESTQTTEPAETQESSQVTEPQVEPEEVPQDVDEDNNDLIATMAADTVKQTYSGEAKAMNGVLDWGDVSGAQSYRVSIILTKGTDEGRKEETLYNELVNESNFSISNINYLNRYKSLEHYEYNITAYSDKEGNEAIDEWNLTGLLAWPRIATLTSRVISYSYVNKTVDKITVTWKVSSSNSDKDCIIQYKNKNGDWKDLGRTDVSKKKYTRNLTATETNWLCNADSHDFRIKVNASDSYGSIYLYTDTWNKAAAIPGNFDWYAKAKKNITVYKSAKGNAKLTTMKKGTAALAVGKYPKKVKGWNVPKRVQVKLSNGKVGWVAWKSVSMVAHVKDHNKFNYSTSAIENHVKNYSSSSKYLIWVSRYTQHTYVFTGKKGDWNLSKDYVCTTANFYQPLYGGVKKIYKHQYRVNKTHKSGRKYYFNYATSFHGSGYFHTRCKWSNNNKWRNSIKTTPSTKGCVRLYDGAAKYIYGLPTGTTVVIK